MAASTVGKAPFHTLLCYDTVRTSGFSKTVSYGHCFTASTIGKVTGSSAGFSWLKIAVFWKAAVTIQYNSHWVKWCGADIYLLLRTLQAMTWLTGLIRNSFLQNLKLGYISIRLFVCFQVEQTIFLTRRISLEIYAIQSSFRVFPFVFFTRSVIEPAPQNSITSWKTNISIQPTLNTVPSCLAKQNNQVAALIWETLVKQRI